MPLRISACQASLPVQPVQQWLGLARMASISFRRGALPQQRWALGPGCLAVLIMSLTTIARASSISSHLATKTRYFHRLRIPNAPSIHETPDPPGYEASALWLLSRHGTRWPTPERMQQIRTLQDTFKAATNYKDYPWLKNWVAPTQGMDEAGGELHEHGEDEMWSLAQRLRKRFPNILRSPYLPRRYPIVSTQVARTAASASAFAAGYFPFIPVHDDSSTRDRASLERSLASLAGGSGVGSSIQSRHDTQRTRPQAVALTMALRDQDPLLRFYDMCPAYAQREEWLETWLPGWSAAQVSPLIPKLEQRLGMTRPLNACDVDALWTLCQFEAGVLEVPDRACRLFTAADVSLLEWVDDVSLSESQGWGSEVNYRIAAPLLQDLRATLLVAARRTLTDASSDVGGRHHRSGTHAPHARLLFAHCETLVPFATLLGLFPPDTTSSHGRTAQASAVERDAVRRVDAQQAMDHLHTVDATEDLSLLRPHVASDNVNDNTSARLTSVREDGADVCGGDPSRPQQPPPAWWTPLVPFDESRLFKGGRISPYGANMFVLLFKSTSTPRSYRVRLVYNEQVVPIPGCKPVSAQPTSGNTDTNTSTSSSDSTAHLDCDLDEFLRATEAAAGDENTQREWCAVGQS